MKISRTPAIVALTALAITGSAGMAAADNATPTKPVNITQKDEAGIKKEWAAVEKSLGNLTAKQKSELKNATAETVAPDVTEKDKAAIEKGWADVEKAFSKISKDLIAQLDKLFGKG